MSFSAGQGPWRHLSERLSSQPKNVVIMASIYFGLGPNVTAILAQKLYFTGNDLESSFDQCWRSPTLGTNYLRTMQLKPLGEARSTHHIVFEEEDTAPSLAGRHLGDNEALRAVGGPQGQQCVSNFRAPDSCRQDWESFLPSQWLLQRENGRPTNFSPREE